MIPLYKYFNFAVMLGFTGIFIGSMIRGIFDKIYIWMIEGVSTVILFSFLGYKWKNYIPYFFVIESIIYIMVTPVLN